MGGRSLKSGQSRWFIGYKKHTLRIWLSSIPERVVLVPLVSWAAPAARADGLFLGPSIQYCAKHLGFCPQIVVGDKAYINLKTQRHLRENYQVSMVTKWRADMRIPEDYDTPTIMTCHQGQRLNWLGYEPNDALHWFGVLEAEPLCRWCWEKHNCPRQFAHAPNEHEIFYGGIPACSQVAQQLLWRSRSWIEATQSYDKNQLGLGDYFLNSLQLCWTMTLLTDTVALLRGRAVLNALREKNASQPASNSIGGQIFLDL